MKPLKTKKRWVAAWGKTKHRFSKGLKRTRLFSHKRGSGLTQEQVDKDLVYALAQSKIPTSDQIKHLKKTLTKKESWIIRGAIILAVLSLSYLGVYLYKKHATPLPVAGGTYYEGVVGYPRNINPVYSQSREVDRDLARLIFSSLFQYDKDGKLVGDLAQSIETSDNKVFVVTVREDAKWHNGEKLTVDDIIFTFHLITSPDYNSPLQRNFIGVTVEKMADNQIKFTLPTVYVGFAHLLTFGIIPQNIWENVAPEFAALNDLNLEPIGSGPYKFTSIVKSKQGEIKEYRLEVNSDYYGAKPYLEKIIFRFYPESTELIGALNSGSVAGISSLSLEQKTSLIAQDSLNFHSLKTTQEDLIFFNPEKNKNLADLKVRRALAHAINKQELVDRVSSGFYTPANSPLTSLSEAYNDQVTKYDFNLGEADRLLNEAGWQKLIINSSNVEATTTPEIKAAVDFATANNQDPNGEWRFKKDDKDKVTLLTVRLSAVDGRVAYKAAEEVTKYWEALGVRVVLEKISVADVSGLISSRSFEAFVFGQVIGADSDLFPFWHSSQIKNGLNIAAYKNEAVDKALADARVNPDVNARWDHYREVQRIIADEVPAIFLYEKNYIFVQDKSLKGFSGTAAVSASDRLSGVSDWFVKSRPSFSW